MVMSLCPTKYDDSRMARVRETIGVSLTYPSGMYSMGVVEHLVYLLVAYPKLLYYTILEYLESQAWWRLIAETSEATEGLVLLF